MMSWLQTDRMTSRGGALITGCRFEGLRFLMQEGVNLVIG